MNLLLLSVYCDCIHCYNLLKLASLPVNVSSLVSFIGFGTKKLLQSNFTFGEVICRKQKETNDNLMKLSLSSIRKFVI